MKLHSVLEFSDQLEAPAVRLAADQCLRARHKEAPCRLCLDACPTHAISEGNPVSLDADRCVTCGLCLHICPTEAFSRPGNGGGKFLPVIDSLEDGRIELACPRKRELEVVRAEVATVVEVKPCLAALSLTTLLAAVTQRDAEDESSREVELWLNDEPCEDCPIGSLQNEISRTVAAVNQMLAAFGKEPRVLTYRESPLLLKEKPRKRPVVQVHRPRYTRRGFFRSLAQPDANLPSLDSVTEAKGSQRLPASRDALIRSLERLGKPVGTNIDVTGLQFGAVGLEGECAACGLCARLCPSDALIFEEDSGSFKIDFLAAACLGCTICSLICPTNAVEMRSEVDPNQLLAETAKTLLTGDLAECKECGMSCAANQDEQLCFVCQWRKTIPVTNVVGRIDSFQ